MGTNLLASGRRREDVRVVLVDDDDALRKVMRQGIAAAGYQVEAFSAGRDAVRACSERCPDVLITDLVLPDINGQELASEVGRACPSALLIFMSGYSSEQLHALDITQVVFLPKPIGPREVVAMLDHLLSTRD